MRSIDEILQYVNKELNSECILNINEVNMIEIISDGWVIVKIYTDRAYMQIFDDLYLDKIIKFLGIEHVPLETLKSRVGITFETDEDKLDYQMTYLS